MKNKSYFLIFLILTQHFVELKICKDFSIRISDYDFSVFRNGEQSYNNVVDGKEVLAFNYIYLYNNYYNSKIYVTINGTLHDIALEEKKKFSPDLLNFLFNKISNKKKENTEFFDSLLDDNNSTISVDLRNEIISAKNEYIKNQEEKNNFGSIIKGFSLNSLFSSSVGGSVIAVKSSSIVSPQFLMIFMAASVLYSFSSKIYNNYICDGNISKYHKRITNLTELWKKLKYLIEQVEWYGNNVVLTAIPENSDCAGFETQFYNSNDVVYNDKKKVIHRMINMTCVFRENCKDYNICYENLLKYIMCKKNREKIKCPNFTKNCQLKYDKYDESDYDTLL